MPRACIDDWPSQCLAGQGFMIDYFAPSSESGQVRSGQIKISQYPGIHESLWVQFAFQCA